MAGKKVYAVRKGRKVGIFTTWAECESYIKGYSGAEYKSFKTRREAEAYMSVKSPQVVPHSTSANRQRRSQPSPSSPSKPQMVQPEMTAYVDGSYDQRRRVYGSGAVIFYNDDKINISEKGQDPDLVDMRNVAGEIEAAKLAMIYAKDQGAKSIAIYHDYEGIAKWCLKEWKTNKIGTQRYAAFYEEISKVLQVYFVKVKAHTGDQYNEEADILAKKAIGLA